ncbi:MAG TPA: hypothetical protein VMR75_03260 [Candidatus Saccharimonadales bacterium]|nr:hypothetical protein [Candidatus Saccharimonadales bacterium]
MVTVPSVALATTHLPHTVPTLSTDATIIVITGLIFAYGVVAGYTALVRESISVYVGLVLANSFGNTAYDAITNNAGNHFPVSLTEVRLLLLIAPILILQFTRRHGHGAGGHKHSLVVTLVLAALAAMLVVSSGLGQLSQTALANTVLNSNLASWIYQLRLLWLAAVPIAIAAGAILHPKSPRR